MPSGRSHIPRHRYARAKILECHPARSEEHLGRAQSMSSDSLTLTHQGPTSF
jgi:hypothetical protein